jgi:hypothetical protein
MWRALLLLVCGCSTSTAQKMGGPPEMSSTRDLAPAAVDLAVGDAAVSDLAVGDGATGDLAAVDLAGLDLIASGDANWIGSPCASGGDCPTSGVGGCCATIQTTASGGSSSQGMCSDSCPVAVSGTPSAATIQTKLCVDSGDCGQFYGTISVAGVPVTELFGTCCSVAGLAQKFCGNVTVAAYGYYTCN